MSSKLLRKSALRAMPAMKNILWMIGGVAVTLGITAAAQQYASTPAAAPPCDLGTAAQNAMNDRIKLIAATSSDPTKYFNQNCLGDLSFASIDLSVMIPDPLGLLTDAALKGINKLKDAAVNKVCEAARNAVGDTINRYNEVITSTNTLSSGFGNGVATKIDSSITGAAQQVSDKYNLNYNTSNTIVSPVTAPATSSWSSPQAAAQVAAPAAAAAPAPATMGGSIFGGR